MYEITNYVNIKKNYPTVIITTPTGKFSLSGLIPNELTREVKSGFSKVKVSVIFETEKEAVDALVNLGITKFQLSDCSWFNA